MIGYRDLEGIVEDATGTNTGKKLLIYDGGNKLLVSYFDANQDEMWLFCDLATGQNEIIKGDECQVAQFLGVYDGTLWYKTYVGGTLYQYDLKTQEKTKVLDFVHDAVVNSDAGIIAYTKKNNSQMLYLYNMNDRKTKYLPLMRWNTYYSDMYRNESRWSDDGRMFFYIRSFIRFFNASDMSLMVYDSESGKQTCIYKVKNTLHQFGYIASEQ